MSDSIFVALEGQQIPVVIVSNAIGGDAYAAAASANAAANAAAEDAASAAAVVDGLASGDGSSSVGDRWPDEGEEDLENLQTVTVGATLKTDPWIDYFREASDPSDDWSLALERFRLSSADRVRYPADKGAVRDYPFASTQNIGSNEQHLGSQKWTARFIKTGNLEEPLVSLNGKSNTVFRDLHFRFDSEPTTSTDAVAIKVTNSQTCTFENLWLAQVGDGIVLVNGGNHKIKSIDCYGYEDTAVTFAGAIDCQLSIFNFYAGDSTKGRNGGIRWQGNTESCTASHGEIKLGVNSITTVNYGSTLRGSAPYKCGLSNVRLDSAYGPAALLRSGLYFSMRDCWLASAGHNSALGYGEAEDAAGIDADEMMHLSVIGCDFVNNGGRGATFYNTNKLTRLIGNTFAQNGYSRDYDVAAVEFLAGSSRFTANGNTFEFIDGPELGPIGSPTFPSGSFRQIIGIAVQTGCDYFDVSGNIWGDCTGFNASPEAEHGSYERNW